jgi:hypothetical protein
VGRAIIIIPTIHQPKSLGGADGTRTIKVVNNQIGVGRNNASKAIRGKGILIFPIQYPATGGMMIRIAHVKAVSIDPGIIPR